MSALVLSLCSHMLKQLIPLDRKASWQMPDEVANAIATLNGVITAPGKHRVTTQFAALV